MFFPLYARHISLTFYHFDTFYKVKDANYIVLTDSVGNEPAGETAKFYVLKKVKNMRLIKNVDSNFATHVFYKS